MRILIICLLTILSSSNLWAQSFDYTTTYWFNKIDLKCRDTNNMCKIWVNKEYKGESSYEMNGRIAYTMYDRYEVELNLDNGNFNWRTK